MASEGFDCSTDGGIARLVLARPERHNALGASDIAALLAALEALEADPALRVLVLTGRGERSFCSGALLGEFESGAMSGELFSTLTDRLAAMRMPTVCVLNGDARGGGAELALCCDYRIGVEGLRVRVPAARIGLCYPVAGMRRYVEKLGLATAKRLLLAAEELDTAALLANGFLDRAVPRERLAAEAEALAEGLAALAPLAVRSMKWILAGLARGDLDEAAAEGAVRACRESADFREGLAAQRERRPPRFEGR